MKTMYEKTLTYVYNCLYGIRCYKREDIERIVQETVDENPNETCPVKLGVKAKRRIQGEL